MRPAVSTVILRVDCQTHKPAFKTTYTRARYYDIAGVGEGDREGRVVDLAREARERRRLGVPCGRENSMPVEPSLSTPLALSSSKKPVAWDSLEGDGCGVLVVLSSPPAYDHATDDARELLRLMGGVPLAPTRFTPSSRMEGEMPCFWHSAAKDMADTESPEPGPSMSLTCRGHTAKPKRQTQDVLYHTTAPPLPP